MSRPVTLALVVAAVFAAVAIYLARLPPPIIADETSPAAAPTFSTVPPIRVLLGKPARERCRVRIDGPYTVTAVGDFRVLAQGERLEEVEIVATPRGLKIAAQEFPAWRLEVQVHKDGALWVDGVRYRGDLRLFGGPDGRLSAINVAPLEAYLASVLPSEMPADFGLAAQQAQVIVARTYALFHMKTVGRAGNYDVYDSTRSQRYRGMQYTDSNGRDLAVETERSRRIVAQTRGMALTYRGRLFCSYFSAVCGGHTMAGAEVFGQAAPPLVGVPCEHCAEAPNYRWSVSLPLDEINRKLAEADLGAPVGKLVAIEVEDPGGGLMPRVRLKGTIGEQTVSAAYFRSHIAGSQLPSERFDARVEGENVQFAGRGWGHGVGLCQWGSKRLAAEGKSCVEILAYYYPGAELLRVE
jgi:stage II sporulation protein D